MTIGKGDFQNPQIHYDEIKRCLYDEKFQEAVYHFGDFKRRGCVGSAATVTAGGTVSITITIIIRYQRKEACIQGRSLTWSAGN